MLTVGTETRGSDIQRQLGAVIDCTSNLRCESCCCDAQSSLEYFIHLHHAHRPYSGAEAALEHDALQCWMQWPRRFIIPGQPKRALQKKKGQVPVLFDFRH